MDEAQILACNKRLWPKLGAEKALGESDSWAEIRMYRVS